MKEKRIKTENKGKRIYKVTKKQLTLITENELEKLYKNELTTMVGDDENDRKIEYPSSDELEVGTDDMDNDTETERPDEFKTDGDDVKVHLPTPPDELLDYLDKLEEAKSILSKIAAKTKDKEMKNRIYTHYEKTSKIAFELIKDFGIVH